MLDPGRRRLFLDTLRPPEGYVLDRAVGTTFTLDLMTLLAVPLAFTFSDVQDRDGQIPTEPLSLLESARRYADRIVVFCHGGQTGVPRARQPALAFIEQSVVAAFLPRRGQPRGIFHPKLWVLRYTARGDAANGPIRYRLVCQSRNLTFDTSWGHLTCARWELDWERVREHSVNGPVADFMRVLPTLALDPLSDSHEESIEVLADELPSVRFDPPEGLKLSRFLPFGIGRRNIPYPDLQHRPVLVISPYLDGEFLQSVARRRARSVLISRREALLTAPAAAVRAFDKIYAFRSSLEPEPEDAEESLPPLAGLHAKVYVMDDGWKARVGIGSANSTEAALGDPPRNVEFMVELVGSKSKFGIDALLTPPGQGEAGTFRSLIEEFDPEEAGTVAEDDDAIRLDYLLDDAAETLARADLTGTVKESDTGRYTLRLALGEPPGLPAQIGAVTCWPATIAVAHQQPLEDGVEFSDLSLDELSAFLAIEVQATVDGRSKGRRFARSIRLSGLPEDRLPRLIANMLRNRERFMQLLWLLLSPDQDVSFGELSELLSDENSGTDWGVALPGLLERMLETLGSDPGKLDAVASLLEDLRKTREGKELIGDEFDRVWKAIWDGTRPTKVTTKKTVEYGEEVLAGLKGFQRKTAEYVFDKLYRAEDSTRRFLIADEVGLGKTLVAAGVIAKAIDHLRENGVPRIDVIYICSNQAIARQNVGPYQAPPAHRNQAACRADHPSTASSEHTGSAGKPDRAYSGHFLQFGECRGDYRGEDHPLPDAQRGLGRSRPQRPTRLPGWSQQRRSFHGVRVAVPKPRDRWKYSRAVQKCREGSWRGASS